MRKFNTTGICVKEENFMVDISKKLEKIEELIEAKEYFTINRPRQYGKSTTISLLKKRLLEKYVVISISFEGIGSESYTKEKLFIEFFFSILNKALKLQNELNLIEIINKNKGISYMYELSDVITELVLASQKDVILIIDEVDKSCNNQLFLDFLGMLRNKYLLRKDGSEYTFHSVILAGLHDIKTLKLKIRPNSEAKYNSPWNIASDFDVDLSFDPDEIATMLIEYKEEKKIDLDIKALSERLYFYTSGYPFLVSKLCQIIDTKIMKENKWLLTDVDKAAKLLLNQSNTNFDSLIKNLENNSNLFILVKSIVLDNASLTFNAHNPDINQGIMYGIFSNQGDKIAIHNKIYLQTIYNYMISKTEIENLSMSKYNFRDNFIIEDFLDMEKILLKFQEFMKTQYTHRNKSFLETNGKLLLLAFIKPIINGKGFDFKEVQISEEKRLDIVITYMDNKYILETKIWHGEEAHKRGLNQLKNYLDKEGVDKGYLVVFDLNKEVTFTENKICVGDKNIYMIRV